MRKSEARSVAYISAVLCLRSNIDSSQIVFGMMLRKRGVKSEAIALGSASLVRIAANREACEPLRGSIVDCTLGGCRVQRILNDFED